MAELAPQEIIASLRRPKTLFTEAYLNDPIFVNTDERFHSETVLTQLNEMPVVKRDGGKYAIIDLSFTGSLFYPVHMTSPLLNRIAYEKTIDREFKEFV